MRIAVMGYGVTGRAAVRYCLSRGAVVMVSDAKNEQELKREYGNYFDQHGISYEGGGHTTRFLSKADAIIISPGISLLEEVVAELMEQDIPLWGEMQVVAPELNKTIIAVTGTNGKSTVTELIGHLLTNAGLKVFTGGNLGTPLFDYLLDPYEVDLFVLELSSFQLESSGEFAPDIALLTNISPDHLDWHGGMDAYVRAKARIFANQHASDVAILNGDDTICRELEPQISAGVLTFGKSDDNHALIGDGSVTVKREANVELFDLSSSRLADGVGTQNSAAAILAVLQVGLTPEQIREGLSSFEIKPHRMQTIIELDGVTFINDSKATNTGAVEAALNGLSGGVTLIAGGKDKGEDYSMLKNAVSEKVDHLILIGESTAVMAKDFKGCCPISCCDSIEDAVRRAHHMAKPGGTVLLSPACASFDMFDSYIHRGESFAEAVRALAEKADADMDGDERLVSNGW